MYKQARQTFFTMTMMLFVALVLIFASSGVSYAAKEDSDGNSWRYTNGKPTSEVSDSSNSKNVPRLLLGASPILGYPSTPGAAGAYRKGIDVSVYQGDIDWATVKASGIDYAILRIGFGNVYEPSTGSYEFKLDSKFVRNATECERLGIPYGVYVFAYSNSVEESKWEARCTVDILKSYHLDYPVYYDVEDSSTIGSHGSSQMCLMTQAFCQVVEDAGYSPGIYASLSWFNNYLNSSSLDRYEKWVAQWYDICEYTKPYGMWQCTSDYSVSGISGRVDLDYDYVKDRTFHCWNHNPVHTAFKAATTSEDGNCEYWYCSTCNKYYLDSESKTETTLANITVKQIETVTLSQTSYIYDGKAKTPSIEVKDSSGASLTNEVDYDVKYSDNIEPGTATATVTFKGKYSGEEEQSFSIKRDISTMTFSAGGPYIYNGEEIKPTVSADGLTEGTDFTLVYSDNVNVGTATVTITGINNCIGTNTIQFTISAQSISKKTISLESSSYEYDGTAKTPSVTIKGLTIDKDYSVEYSNNINAGTAKVTVTGKGNYTGTAVKEFLINKVDISDLELVLTPSYCIYNGLPQKPTVTIEGLSADDYTVEYENNTAIGTAKVVVTGKTNYEGTIKKDFRIGKDLSSYTIQLSQTTYKSDGTEKKPVVTISGLEEGKDYQVEYSNNIDGGQATAKAIGIGDYVGSTSSNFTIIPACKVYGTIKGDWASIKIIDEDQNVKTVLNETGSKDCSYEIKYLEEGEYTLVVTPKGAFTGKEYEITVNSDVEKNIIVGQAGDTNLDGVLTADDVTRLARHLAKIDIETNTYKLQFFETDRIGEIDAADVTHLARYLAKIIPEL